MNERIEMLKEMVEKIANPAGWIGYYEGKPATFLFKQEDVPIFLKNTEPVGSVVPLYTAPRELSQEEIDDVIYELRQKSFDPERWLDVYTVAIETIIQLRDELAILKKASEK
jgi:hypothetical protein